MKKNILGVIAVLGIPLVASASMTINGIAVGESLCERNEKKAIADSRDILSPEIMEYEAAAVQSGEEDFASYHAVLAEPGTLESVFGDRLLVTDSLSVEGPVGEEDFSTMWKATFYGRLRAIDLRPATVVGGKIPRNAFFHYDEQMSKKDSRHCPLRSIYFPEGVTEIGEGAISMCYDLTSVNFPSTLRHIDEGAFMICLSLPSETLDFNEGLEEIGDKAFYNCRGMGGEIEFPKSLRRIGSSAFHDCSFSGVCAPEGIEYLGYDAFSFSNFTSVILPDGCSLDPRGSQFEGCWELTEIHLPESLQSIPPRIFAGCFNLSAVNIPSGTVEIGESAFQNAGLAEVDFPAGLESIDSGAFESCRQLERVVLPVSLGYMGHNAFGNCGLKEVYSMPAAPPATGPYYEHARIPSPFNNNDREIPVYVPVGTSELYRQATGWDYFSNYIEVTDFPGGLGVNGAEVESAADAAVYDLMGRRIAAPAPGQIYIRNGRKHIAPVR